MSGYTPIDCNLYDRYEAWATLRTPLVIAYRTEQGGVRTAQGTITDLRNEDGGEWVVLGGGERIRMDHIVRTEEAV